MPVDFVQYINGHVKDFSSIAIRISTPAPIIFNRVTAINYEQSNTPGELRGTSALVLGRSRGQYSANASMTIYVDEYHLLLDALAKVKFPNPRAGYMEKPFDVMVSYAETDSRPVQDVLRACRIVRDSSQNSAGSDPSMIDVDLHVIELIRDRKKATRDGAMPF